MDIKIKIAFSVKQMNCEHVFFISFQQENSATVQNHSTLAKSTMENISIS